MIRRRSAPVTVLLALLAAGCSPSESGGDAASWSLVDVTEQSGVDFRYSFGDDAFSFILEDTGSGASTFDYDGDGDLDLYLVNSGWLEGVSDPAARDGARARNQLYRNRGDGTFENVTPQAGVGDDGYGMAALVGDYDGDGDLDLYVLNYGPNVFYQNQGDGTFRDVTGSLDLAGPERLNDQIKWSVNGFFFDYDRDGDLDLYVANYLAFDPRFVDPNLPEDYPYPGPESYAGQSSLLYQNDDGEFRDVTAEAGLLRENGKTMGATAADFDGDGWLDIFEAVDDMQNFLFRNRGDGTFEEVGEMSGVAYNEAGKSTASMHPCVGDVDGDGLLDVFVPDLEFGCLYRNQGDFVFAESSAAAGLLPKPAGSGWGAHFADFDNDGDLDLLVLLGGAFSLEGAEADRLLLNDGQGRFRDASAELGGYFDSRNVSRGGAFGDFDNDGDIDFVVNRKDVAGTPNLVRNDLESGAHWIMLKLVGRTPNREAIGARVELKVGGRTQVREVRRSGSYLSQNDPRVHFGLGEATRIESLKITWPSGETRDVDVPGVDRLLVIEQ